MAHYAMTRPFRSAPVILTGMLLPALPLLAEEVTTLETVVVSAAAERTLFEQAQPISILSGEELKLRLEPTLGEVLRDTPGVSSTYFGPGASRPIIRGLDADRIRILQNGSNTIDASSTSVDHAVSFDPISVERIEVVRGPATLLYGPNAIGGVVNVIDRRIPEERIDRPVQGSVEGRYGSVNGERGGAFTLEGGIGGFAWHLEGYKRATDELHIPGHARSDRLRRAEPLEPGEKEAKDVLPNSDLRTEGLSGGASYIWDGGYLGAGYSGYHTNYGTVAEPNVTIDMEQRRFDTRGALFQPLPGIKSLKFTLGISDYEHTEFEGSVTGTRFENEGYDGRFEIAHEKLGPFEGTLGYQTEHSDFSALGEEAFLPKVETTTHSAFLFEEVELGPVRLQGGLRYDHIEVDSAGGLNFGAAQGRTFDNVSGSLGAVWTPVDGYAVALTGGYSQRAPTYQELFANGPHVATDSFEIGDADLGVEENFSLDLSLRKKTGRVTGAISAFYYKFHDFIGNFATGEFAGEEDELLPVYAYRSTDAEFWGGEAELTIHLIEPQAPATEGLEKGLSKDAPVAPAKPSHGLHLQLKADYVHAEDTETGDPLPRIPPFHAGAALIYEYGRFNARVGGQYAARQNRTADEELPTDSYFLVDASVSYGDQAGPVGWTAYVKGVNLTNAEAREHTSFLKDIAPLAGRGVLVGLKLDF